MMTMTMTDTQVRELLLTYKKDKKMSDMEWRKFCKRYATRNVSTVVWEMKVLYGELPKNISVQIQEQMQAFCTELFE